MKNRAIQLFTIATFGLILSFSTYKLCYYVAEHYFFDKFFYFKSIDHGYYIPSSKDSDQTKYKERARDIIALGSNNPNVLGTNDGQYFKIAIIGDSLVWGQGIRNEERFAAKLEKKLNKVRPTKIYSLGNSGDNAFDNYRKYQQSIITFGKMDLYIFAFYNNDLVLNNDDRYMTNKLLTNNLSIGCKGDTVYDPVFDPNNLNDHSFYDAKLKSLDSDTVNYCAFSKLATALPKDNALYIDLGSIEGEHEVQIKFAKIISEKLDVLSLPPVHYLKAKVSLKEGHPSAYSNQLYTDTLYQNIVANNKYKFIQ